jgi:large subunit ribosomal protein L32
MAVPKSKSSPGRRNQRRAQSWKISTPTLVACKKCGELMMPHRVCKACGSYNKKEVIATAE